MQKRARRIKGLLLVANLLQRCRRLSQISPQALHKRGLGRKRHARRNPEGRYPARTPRRSVRAVRSHPHSAAASRAGLSVSHKHDHPELPHAKQIQRDRCRGQKVGGWAQRASPSSTARRMGSRSISNNTSSSAARPLVCRAGWDRARRCPRRRRLVCVLVRRRTAVPWPIYRVAETRILKGIEAVSRRVLVA
jgi:hypothetical protein